MAARQFTLGVDMEHLGDGIYNIPESNFKKFEAAIEKLSKKSSKLIGETITPIVFGYHMEDQKNGGQIKVYEVLIGGPSPMLNGWTFISKIDHSNKEIGNLVRTIPGASLPDIYRTRSSMCDHCNVNRFRRDTFVVKHDQTGETKQVGSTCLKDFLGHDNPEKIAKLAELLGYADEIARGYRNSVGGDRRYLNLDAYLTQVAKLVRQQGYFITRASARERHGSSTSDLALSDMMYDNKMRRDSSSKADFELAEKAIEWAQNLGEDGSMLNEYQHNIKVIASSGAIEFRWIGFAASIINAFLREKNQVKPKIKESHHVGVVGEAIEVTVTVKKVTGVDGAYGYSYLHKFETSDGDVVSSFINKKVADEGAVVTIKGTVKKHDVFREVKQTNLSRVKVV